MDFALKSPCDNCPFRRDCLVGWLGEDRAEGIIKSITEKAGTFRCHKTGRTTGGKKVDEQHCAGAIILLEKLKQPSQMMRIAERLGLYDLTKMKMDAPVFDTVEDFITHHGQQRETN